MPTEHSRHISFHHPTMLLLINIIKEKAETPWFELSRSGVYN